MMFDLQKDALGIAVPNHTTAHLQRPVRWQKSLFDFVLCQILMLPLIVIAALLFVINPLFNAGPVVFRQKRMGQNCRPFTALKFRTMSVATGADRGAFDALEDDRIGALGHFLRATRIDELPQIINVLRGEMSLIGPRPDSFDHACVYLREVPDYALRYQITPGISGYAQTEVGYVDGAEGMRRKVDADLFYIARASLKFDLWITWRTLAVVLGQRGR